MHKLLYGLWHKSCNSDKPACTNNVQDQSFTCRRWKQTGHLQPMAVCHFTHYFMEWLPLRSDQTIINHHCVLSPLSTLYSPSRATCVYVSIFHINFLMFSCEGENIRNVTCGLGPDSLSWCYATLLGILAASPRADTCKVWGSHPISCCTLKGLLHLE